MGYFGTAAVMPKQAAVPYHCTSLANFERVLVQHAGNTRHVKQVLFYDSYTYEVYK